MRFRIIIQGGTEVRPQLCASQALLIESSREAVLRLWEEICGSGAGGTLGGQLVGAVPEPERWPHTCARSLLLLAECPTEAPAFLQLRAPEMHSH